MTTTETTSTQGKSTEPHLARAAKKRSKSEGRKKRVQKLKTDKEFAKAFFESKAKRAADKKSAFRKKKSRKK